MEEIWKDIKGFEGLYEASTFGRIRAYPKRAHTKGRSGNSYVDIPQRVLANVLTTHKYYKATLTKDRKQYTYQAHRLIAQTFLDNPENKPCVNHIDGDKLNNRLDNLEWVTYSENSRHAISLGLQVIRKGFKGTNNRKLICSKSGKIYNKIGDAAKEFNIPYPTLSAYLLGRCKNKTSLKYYEL